MRTEKRAMYKACHQCGNDHLVGDPCIPGGNKPATAINLVEVTYKDPLFSVAFSVGSRSLRKSRR